MDLKVKTPKTNIHLWLLLSWHTKFTFPSSILRVNRGGTALFSRSKRRNTIVCPLLIDLGHWFFDMLFRKENFHNFSSSVPLPLKFRHKWILIWGYTHSRTSSDLPIETYFPNFEDLGTHWTEQIIFQFWRRKKNKYSTWLKMVEMVEMVLQDHKTDFVDTSNPPFLPSTR